MKKFLLAFLILIFSIPAYAAVDLPDTTHITFEPIRPEPQHKNVSQLVTNLLVRNHYKKHTVGDSLSVEMFDRYLKRLDFNRLYFLQSDIDKFEEYRYSFDDLVLSGNVTVAYEIFQIYQQRVAERLEYIYKRLRHEFDFTLDEYIEFDREETAWATTPAELDELWRKRLKHDALNLKLAGKDWEGIQETLVKRYQRVHKNVSQYQSEDVFQLLMNALAETFDPHTSYFSPKSFDDFKIEMSQSLEGIGARLRTEEDFTLVVEIVPGGPADKSNILHPNDRITGVGQGSDGEIIDVVGWRIDDVVQLIRGDKGTTVRLELLRANDPVGAPSDTIALVRDKVKLEDQTAKSEILELEHEGQPFKFGVITIPTFYADYEGRREGDPDYKSTSSDVRKILQEFKDQQISGVIVDLRRNGGGFLNEAVDLTGLFIDQGPVVQVRNSNGALDVKRDTDPSVAYDGPLAVIVDRLSASASEIFAAAIQDYDRGIIIGSDTFGKGTVQNAIDLNRFVRSGDLKLGQLKLTVAKFYRIDGRSTQHVGVTPDIEFPTRFSLMDIGESSRENALLYDVIDPLRYNNRNDHGITQLVPRIENQHNVRLSNNAEYASLMDDLREFEANRNRTRLSLNENVRRQEREENKNEDDDPHLMDNESAEADTTEADEEEEDSLEDDLMLMESAHVLGDYILLSESTN